MIRAAVLYDANERKIGTTRVPETCFIIQHDGALFVRQPQGIRLGGGGIGAVFVETEPAVREKLSPA